MDSQQVKQVILQELPGILQRDPEVESFILRLSRRHFADKEETESRFDRVLDELRRDREEQTRKWEENQQAIRQNQADIQRNQADIRQDRADIAVAVGVPQVNPGCVEFIADSLISRRYHVPEKVHRDNRPVLEADVLPPAGVVEVDFTKHLIEEIFH